MFSFIPQIISEKLGNLGDFLESEISFPKLLIIFVVMSFSCKVNTEKFSISYDPIIGKAILALAAFAPGNSGIKFAFWHQETHNYESKQDSYKDS